MNHETARLYMIDRLYNELLQETEQQLEEYLQQHPELLAEWQELCQAHGFMQQINPPQPAPALQEAIYSRRLWYPNRKGDGSDPTGNPVLRQRCF